MRPDRREGRVRRPRPLTVRSRLFDAACRRHRHRPGHAARLRRRGDLEAAPRRQERRARSIDELRGRRPRLPDRLRDPARRRLRRHLQSRRSGSSRRSSARSTTSSSTASPPPTRRSRTPAGSRRPRTSRMRTGVLIGSGIGGLDGIDETAITLNEKGPRRVSPFFIPGRLINLVSRPGLDRARAEGPEPRGRHRLLDRRACDRRRGAADRARRRRRHGRRRRGSADQPARARRLRRLPGAVDRTSTTSPTSASRPYDQDRDGFVMGEGAGVVVLEDYEHAKARGAKIYAEVVGYGLSGDAYHITAPAEDGDGAYRCMQMALKRAGIDAGRHRLHQRPRHLDAAGRRDRARRGRAPGRQRRRQARRCRRPSRRSAICSAPPARSRRSSRSSPSATRSRRRRSTSTTRRSRRRSTSCRTRRKKREIDVVLSNSFGFGGTNASLVFRRAA